MNAQEITAYLAAPYIAVVATVQSHLDAGVGEAITVRKGKQPIQLLDGRGRLLAWDKAHALQALRVSRQVILQQPTVYGATQDSCQLLVLQTVDGERHAGAIPPLGAARGVYDGAVRPRAGVP